MPLQTNDIKLQTVMQISITPEQLRSLIIEAVEEALRGEAKEQQDECYTRAEVAEILKVSANTIKNYEKSGHIKRMPLPGSRVRYNRESLMRIKAITNK